MNNKNLYKRKENILDYFENGKERYNNSPLFNAVIHQLNSGVDPYEIIDHLCKSNDELLEKLTDFLKKNPIQYIIKDDAWNT